MSQHGFMHEPTSGAGKLVLYAVLAIVMMVIDHREGYLREARGMLSVVTRPVIALAHLPGAASSWLTDNLVERRTLRARTEEAEAELLLARHRLARLEVLEAENARLRALLDSSAQLRTRVEVAELLRVDLDPSTHKILINRGSADGVFVGQAVTDAAGIIGQVEEVGPGTATVRLISDASHALPVRVNRSGLRAVAYGTGSADELVLTDIAMSADIEPGDLLITSGLGGRFPAGYPVARVTLVARNPGARFLEARAEPTAALTTARQVLLIFSRSRAAEAEDG